MGTDLEIQVLIESRKEILMDILNNLRSWDNTIESGIGIIESNQMSLNQLEDLNSELYLLTDVFSNDEEYNLKLNLIVKELEKLTTALKNKRKNLLEEKQQFSKKDQVIKNYISFKREPVFIDKDVQ